jgi:hypothetical protein
MFLVARFVSSRVRFSSEDRWNRGRSLWALSLAVALGCEASDSSADLEPRSDASPEILYAYSIVVSKAADGATLSVDEQGTWTIDLAERVARPWLHVHEGLVHEDEAWFVTNADGTLEIGYRVAEKVTDPIEPASPSAVAPML